MSKKHFIALADVMRKLKPPSMSEDGIGMNTRMQREARRNQWLDTVDVMADFCRSQNSAFMRDRWLDYINGNCGPNSGTIKGAK